jgi:hypothetical protein
VFLPKSCDSAPTRERLGSSIRALRMLLFCILTRCGARDALVCFDFPLEKKSNALSVRQQGPIFSLILFRGAHTIKKEERTVAPIED